MIHQSLSLGMCWKLFWATLNHPLRNIKRDNLVSFEILNEVLNKRSINVVKALGSSFASKFHSLSWLRHEVFSFENSAKIKKKTNTFTHRPWCYRGGALDDLESSFSSSSFPLSGANFVKCPRLLELKGLCVWAQCVSGKGIKLTLPKYINILHLQCSYFDYKNNWLERASLITNNS